MAEHCPTCGQAVEVVTSGEGTSHYAPAEACRALEGVRDLCESSTTGMVAVSALAVELLAADMADCTTFGPDCACNASPRKRGSHD